jgi:hypothetical protein
MSSTAKAERIEESLWDKHRLTIERLYVKEQRKLETKDGVIEYMKIHHGFTARYRYYSVISRTALTTYSKSQYESHFKKWRLRKNLTRAEWRQIIRYIRLKSFSGEQLEGLFKGTVISSERILREIARYGTTKEGIDGFHEGLLLISILHSILTIYRFLHPPRGLCYKPPTNQPTPEQLE